MVVKLSHQILRSKMAERGLKQESFAEMLGISARHVRNLCYKDVDISVSLCYRLSVIFDTSMESLLTCSEEAVEEECVLSVS